MIRHGPTRVLPLQRMSLLFEAVFEQLEIDLGAVARDSKIVGQAAVVAAKGARQQQSQKCKTSRNQKSCNQKGGHRNCGLLGDRNCRWLIEWRSRWLVEWRCTWW